MTLRDVIEKYFKGERMIYFHPSDRQGECFLRCRLDGGAELTMGSDDGEVMILYTSSPEKLDNFLNLLIH